MAGQTDATGHLWSRPPPLPLMPVLKITTYFSFGSDFHYKSTIPAYAVKHGLNYIRVAERRETHVEKMKKIFFCISGHF